MKLTCPKCSAALALEDANLAEGVCRCRNCQEFFKISALLTGDALVTRTAKPAYSTVEFVSDRDSLGLIVPPGKDRKAGYFFLVFALFWNALTWTMFVVTLSQGEIFPTLFLIPFILVGAVVAGLCLFMFKGEFTLSIDRQECRAIWSILKWNYTRKVATPEITAVREDVVYRKNYQPVYGIGLVHGSRTLKFGSGLTEDERKWLIGEIRHFLKIPG